MILPKQIRKFRANLHLSQEELAEKCGVSRQAVAKWESGESTPEVLKLVQLSQVFGITLDELVLGKKGDNMSKNSNGMTEAEVNEFIETMAEFNDIWTEEQVIDVYGERSLEDALTERKAEINHMADIFERILKR